MIDLLSHMIGYRIMCDLAESIVKIESRLVELEKSTDKLHLKVK